MSEIWQSMIDWFNNLTRETTLVIFGALGLFAFIGSLVLLYKFGTFYKIKSALKPTLRTRKRNTLYGRRSTFDLSFEERRRMITRLDGEQIPIEHLPRFTITNLEKDSEESIPCLCGGFFLHDSMFCSNCGRNRSEGKDELAEMWGYD